MNITEGRVQLIILKARLKFGSLSIDIIIV